MFFCYNQNEDDEYDDNEARKVLDFHSGVHGKPRHIMMFIENCHLLLGGVQTL